MPGIENFGLFLLSSLILCVIPGVDMIFILGKTFTSRNRPAPIICTFGITAGLAIHTCVVAFGIGYFLANSPLAFQLVRAAGGAYLFWLGIGALKAKSEMISIETETEIQNDVRSNFLQGLGVNLMNPKVVLFFLSYLPQFISWNAPNSTVSLLILGGTFCIIGTLWNLSLVFAGSFIKEALLNSPKRLKVVNRIAGIVFVALAVQIFTEIAISIG